MVVLLALRDRGVCAVRCTRPLTLLFMRMVHGSVMSRHLQRNSQRYSEI